MSFQTQVTELSAEALDQLFEQTPTTTPTADNLAVGIEQENIVQVGGNTIPIIDLDDLEKESISTNEEVEKEEEIEETDKTVDEEPAQEEQIPQEEVEQINSVLKNTVEYLVQQGIWADFNGREDLEMDQETYAQLAAQQAQELAYGIVDEMVNSTGAYGRAIIDHIRSGGNPEEIIDLFKEQKAVQQIDTSTEVGKQSKIESYYKDILGWSQARVQKHVNRLIEHNEIDEEFESVDALYNKHFQERLEETQTRQKEIEQENLRKQEQFVNNIKGALDSNTQLTVRDKQAIASSILDFKHKLPNGQKVNDFYLKFAEIQSDPSEYVELVRFVMDRQKYLQEIKQKEETKANKKAFNFIKGNAAASKAKSQDIGINNDRTPRVRGTDFSFVK